MINILLSVRQPFSRKILSGEKSWQYLTPDQAAILERRGSE